ncbi:Retrovirus-related Pol polyprotein from transposon TNT 1-94, partial [Bienertia sinuspersici]
MVETPNSPPSSSSNTTTPFHPAFAVNNIKAAIPVLLDNEDSQYTAWSEHFQIHACAYNVMDHIDSSIPKPVDLDSATWTRLDALVKQWIYATISKDLGATILQPGATALQLWNRLKEIFQDHKETRAIYLEEQLASTKLAQFANVSDYCKHLKSLADQLANVDSPLTDKQLVLRLIAGLTKGEYDGVALLLQHQKPFPTFADARSQLLLEERRRANQDESPDSTALLTTETTVQTNNTAPSHSPASAPQFSGRGGSSSRGSRGGRG